MLHAQAPTHRGVDSGGSGAGLGLLDLQGREPGPRKQAQALAAPAGDVQGLEGAEGWRGGFAVPCEQKEDSWGFSMRGCLSPCPPRPAGLEGPCMPVTRDLEERDGYDRRRNAGGTWGTSQGRGVRGPGGTEGLRQHRGLSWKRYHEGELRCHLAFRWPGVGPTVREGRQALLRPSVLHLPLSPLPSPPSSLRSIQQTLSPLFSGLSGPAAPEKEKEL